MRSSAIFRGLFAASRPCRKRDARPFKRQERLTPLLLAQIINIHALESHRAKMRPGAYADTLQYAMQAEFEALVTA